MSTVTFTTSSVSAVRPGRRPKGAADRAGGRSRTRERPLALRALRAFASAAFEVALLGDHTQREAGVRRRYVHIAEGGDGDLREDHGT